MRVRGLEARSRTNKIQEASPLIFRQRFYLSELLFPSNRAPAQRSRESALGPARLLGYERAPSVGGLPALSKHPQLYPSEPTMSNDPNKQAWYSGITKYQWLVLLIASLGWIFDIFEGQIFVSSMRDVFPDLLGVGPDHPKFLSWADYGFAAFALGGALGGVVFGIVSDKIGRSKTLIITILFYSVFTLMQAFVQEAWQLIALRFVVAMGVGGEWAVASAMVAEVMPTRARPVMSSIFHASSVFGTLLAAAAGAFIVGNEDLGWRWGFAIGVLPALLTVWIRWKMKEPEQWTKAREKAKADTNLKPGRISELFNAKNLRNTLVGVTLASIGLVTFWGAHIYGKDALLRNAQAEVMVEEGVPNMPPAPEDLSATQEYKEQKAAAFEKHKSRIKNAEMLSMTLNTIGGGLGLVLFGAISNRLGRKGAFVLYHAVAFVMVLIMFKGLIPHHAPAWLLVVTLPVFGFFTLGMHAGYAVYFPELYPTRLRGTGSGFCFNMGRLAMALAFFLFGMFPVGPSEKAMLLSPLYLVGVAVVYFAKETRGIELEE